MIHLDTSFLIRALLPDSPENHKLREWFDAGDTMVVSAVAWAEFLCGPLTDDELEIATRIVEPPQDFRSEHATIAAQLFNASGRRRGTMVDCMIAAASVSAGAPLATANTDDFRRFAEQGLQLA